MDNITFLENPYSSIKRNSVVYEVANDYKVAKLNNTTKRPSVVVKWINGIATITPTVQEQSAVKRGIDDIISKYMCVTTDYNYIIDIMEGARKLKVNDKTVANKVRIKYKESGRTKIERPVSIKETPAEVAITPVPPVEVQIPKVEEPVSVPEIRTPAYEPDVEEQLSNTRVGRLTSLDAYREAKNESTKMESAVSSLRREDVHEDKGSSDIINTPSRFRTNEESRTTPSMYDSLINDNVAKETREETPRREEATRGGDPDRYQELMNRDDNVSKKLAAAKMELSSVIGEQNKAIAVNQSLSAEINNIRATIEQIKRDKAENARKELDNTLNMLKEAKAEILGETRKYDSLQRELADLIRQRDALLNENDNDTYSSRMAA